MTKVHLIRVLIDANGQFGDVVPVIIDEGRRISDADRQTLAQKLKAPETVFINDVPSADISIMHSQGEVDFAGVPSLAVAWLLSKLNRKPITSMKGRAGDILVSQNGELTQVRANLATMPPWNHKQLESAEAVERIALTETTSWEHTMVWAWVDEAKGLIRARTFASDWNIPEAQGNGSGSMMLAAMEQRPVEIKHGDGSVVYAKPAPDNCADIGGRIAEDPSIDV